VNKDATQVEFPQPATKLTQNSESEFWHVMPANVSLYFQWCSKKLSWNVDVKQLWSIFWRRQFSVL